MPTLLVVHHTVSPATQSLLEAALAGARAEGLEDVTVEVRPALAAGPSDVLAADGFFLLTPANIGYVSGALKHFFDQVYYPTLLAKPAAPYGVVVHGNNDTAGALRAVETITTGLGWAAATAPVSVVGEPDKAARDAAWEAAATVAATLLEG